MKILFPMTSQDKDYKGWANKLIVALTRAFDLIPEFPIGGLILWKADLDPPPGFLVCDGGEYASSVSLPLYKLFGESTPGNFEVPNLTGPSGTIVLVRAS